jgi:integrase
LLSNLLLLQRHTGMRIGECVDLALDCLFPLGPDHWVIHVPLGKLKTERWVPVDSAVHRIVERLRALRSPTANSDPFLLPRNRARETLIRRVRPPFAMRLRRLGSPADSFPIRIATPTPRRCSAPESAFPHSCNYSATPVQR